MRIVSFASGSTGNSSLISEGEANILIDAGISMRRIVNCLAQCDLTPHDVSGVLISHEHSDHISGLSMLTKHHGLKLFAPEILADTLCDIKPELEEYINIIPIGEDFELDGIKIRAFHTPHDSVSSFGYRISGEHSFAFATDTGHISDEMLSNLGGAEAVIIEANHDVEMLKNGPYPYYLKKRILSERGHLSNTECGKLAFHLANSGTKHIILGHLSRENNSPQKAFDAVSAALGAADVSLSVAPMSEMLEISLGEDSKCLV